MKQHNKAVKVLTGVYLIGLIDEKTFEECILSFTIDIFKKE
jgi:hypothetical protein